MIDAYLDVLKAVFLTAITGVTLLCMTLFVVHLLIEFVNDHRPSQPEE